MSALASFVSGRRTKWVVIGLWIVAVVAPVVLIATVMASFLGTLGLSIFFFIERDRVWWPSTARGGGHALREHAEPDEEPVPA